MTSVTPPTYYFDGITFNSAFYTTSSTGGLTQAQVNALYLKKNTADTATALETFNGGILTNDIQPTTATTDMSICSSQTSGILNIGCVGNEAIAGRTTGVINIGTDLNATGIIKIGNQAAITPVQIRGALTVARAFTASATATCSSTLGVSGLLTATGGLAVGTSANILTGNGANATVNIFTGNTSAGSVNIATGSGINQSTTVNISNGSTTGVVTIGNTNNSVVIGSGRQTDICHQIGMINAVNILSGGGATTGGSVNIANGAGQTTTVNIATVTSIGALTIGANTNTTTLKSGTVNIQNVANTGGTVNIKNGTDATGSVNIASGGAIGTPTVSVNIASGATNGTVTIGNTENTVQINGTLAMGTGKGITLSPNTSYALPSAGQLGVSGTITGITTTTLANTMTTIRSVSLTAGVWIIIGNVGMGNSGTSAYLSISATSVRDNNSVVTTTTTSGAYINITRVISQTTTITWNLLALTQIAGTLSDINFSATRIG